MRHFVYIAHQTRRQMLTKPSCFNVRNKRLWRKAAWNDDSEICDRQLIHIHIHNQRNWGTESEESTSASTSASKWQWLNGGEMKIKKNDTDISTNGMLCAMSCKIEKCRTRHFSCATACPSLTPPPAQQFQISFPINVNYVIYFCTNGWKQKRTNAVSYNQCKMVRKNW